MFFIFQGFVIKNLRYGFLLLFVFHICVLDTSLWDGGTWYLRKLEKLMSKKISLGQIRKNTGIFKAGSFKERKGWEKEENGGGRLSVCFQKHP